MQKPPETFFNLADFMPGLRQEFEPRPLNPKKIILAAIPVKNPEIHRGLVLGTRPLSQAEFEAIMARLERSCRTFERGPTSRNYIAALRTTLGQGGGH